MIGEPIIRVFACVWGERNYEIKKGEKKSTENITEGTSHAGRLHGFFDLD